MTTNRSRALLLTAPLLMGLVLSPTVACVAGSGAGASDEDVDTHGITFEEFKASTYKDPISGVYVVNGDEVLETDRELQDFYLKNIVSDALIVNQAGGVDQIWDATQKLNISYCVSKTFNGNYAKVQQAMADATGAWAAAANVKFVYKSDQDGSCTANNSNVVFDVRPVSGQQYLARAFFPGQSRSTRNVLIDSSSFGNIGVYTLTGILRHELGHTLGFRHEQTRPEAGASSCYEDNNFRPLTPYDSNSVMHYPQCNGTNNGDLVLTQKDKDGIAALYGAPGAQPPPPPPPPGGGSCTHTKCATGTALKSDCDAAVTKVCAADAYCCTTSWDSQCVSEVKSIAGDSSCSSQSVPCSHAICKTGTKLTVSCDPCVKAICAVDSYCCSTSWDGTCVGEVASVCKQTCQ